MKRRFNFKTVYLCILAALAVICVLCVIHVHSILVDYENSQPENVALARVQALGDRPLSDLMDTSSLTVEETAHLETLARGSDLSCKLKKTTDGGATLVYTVMSGDERVCDVTLKSGSVKTKLTIFTITDWSVAKVTPSTFDYTLKLPRGLSVYVDGVAAEAVALDGGFVQYNIESVAKPDVTVRDASGNSVVYDGKTSVSVTNYTVKMPSNMRLLDAEGNAIDTSDADVSDIAEYKYVSEYAEMPKLLTFKLPLLSDETPQIRITDESGADVLWSEADHVITSSLVSSADALPDGRCSVDYVLEAAKNWSLFMTADLGGKMYGFDTMASYLMPDSYLYGVAKSWATGVDITFTSVHTLNRPPFSYVSARNFTIYGDDCFSCDVYLTKVMHLNTGANVTDVLNSRFYLVRSGDGWLVADIIEIID